MSIIYWGNDTTTLGEYEAPDASSASIVRIPPEKFLVDWGNGDVVELLGTTYEVSTSYDSYQIPRFIISYTLSGTPAATTVASFDGVSPQIVEYRPFSDPSILRYYLFTTYTGWRATFPTILDGQEFYSQSTTCRTSLSAFYGSDWGRWKRLLGSNQRSASIQGVSPTTPITCRLTGHPIYTVTTNTGASSTRPNKTPTVTPVGGGCAIQINYVDGTTEQLNVGTCPDWVRVGFECPQACTIADRIITFLGG